MLKKNALFINSFLIILTSSMLGTLLHEYAHFLIGTYLNLKPVFHNDHILFTIKGTIDQQVLVAAIGPLFSLIFAAIILIVAIKLKKPYLVKLFFLWLGLDSFLKFFGYFLIAPFFKYGDTGIVFDFFGIPTMISVFIAFISLLIIRIVFLRITNQFLNYGRIDNLNKKENGKSLFLYPILLYMVVMVILSIPKLNLISLLPILCFPVAYLSIMRNYNKLNSDPPKFIVSNIPFALPIICLVTLLIFIYLS